MERLPGLVQIKAAIDCKRFKQANKILAQFLDRHPDCVDGVFLDGVLRYFANDRESARSRWEYALILSPSHLGAHEWMAHLNDSSSNEPALTVDQFEEDLKSPAPRFYPLTLCFRPQKFFSRDVVYSKPWLIGLFIWLIGFQYGYMKLDASVSRIVSRGTEPENIPLPFVHDWTSFWLWMIPLCFVAGGGFYIVYGFLFRIFLRICGAKSPDIYLSRRVMVYPSILATLPFLIIMIIESFSYRDPLEGILNWNEMEVSDWLGYLYLIFLVGLVWSMYIGYRGIRCCFAVKKWRTRFLYAIIPIFCLFLAIASQLASEPIALVEKPDVQNAQTLDRDLFSVQHPGNWVVTFDEDDERSFTIEPEFENAYVSFSVYDEAIDPQEIADFHLTYFGLSTSYVGLSPLTRWGTFDGKGYQMEFEEDGATYNIEVFAARQGNRGFGVIQTSESSILQKMYPGFIQIQDSFQLKK